MKHGAFFFAHVAYAIACAQISLAALPVRADDPPKVLFEEPFDSKLADGWSWVREDPKAWRIEKGALIIKTSTGSLWKTNKDAGNILVRKPAEAKDTPLAIEVLVENEPSNAFEHAGLVWYYDDVNYVILVKEKAGDKPIVQLVSEKDGNPKTGFAEKPFDGKEVWLRMEVSGNKIVGRFRKTDKDDWQTLGESELPGKANAQIGLLTGFAPRDKEHESTFRHFKMLAVSGSP